VTASRKKEKINVGRRQQVRPPKCLFPFKSVHFLLALPCHTWSYLALPSPCRWSGAETWQRK